MVEQVKLSAILGVCFIVLSNSFESLALVCKYCDEEFSDSYKRGDCSQGALSDIYCRSGEICLKLEREGSKESLLKTKLVSRSTMFNYLVISVHGITNIRKDCASVGSCRDYEPLGVTNYKYSCSTCNTNNCNLNDIQVSTVQTSLPLPAIRPAPAVGSRWHCCWNDHYHHHWPSWHYTAPVNQVVSEYRRRSESTKTEISEHW